MNNIRVVDPDAVPETLVAGPFNCSVTGDLATLTFTHARPIAEKLFAGPVAEMSLEAVIRARLVMPVEGLQNLRDSIDALLRGRLAQGPASGNPAGH
jgi:hypothetical protein